MAAAPRVRHGFVRAILRGYAKSTGRLEGQRAEVSENTFHEDSCISSTGDAVALERKPETSKTMKAWKEITRYAGLIGPKAITTLWCP
jgi:hypothetical protein